MWAILPGQDIWWSNVQLWNDMWVNLPPNIYLLKQALTRPVECLKPPNSSCKCYSCEFHVASRIVTEPLQGGPILVKTEHVWRDRPLRLQFLLTSPLLTTLKTLFFLVNAYLYKYNIYIYIYIYYTEVSWNGGTPKSSMFVGFSSINHPAIPIYGNP